VTSEEASAMSGDGYSYQGQPSAWLMRAAVAVVLAVIGIGFIAVRSCTRDPEGHITFAEMSPKQEVALGIQAYNEALKGARVLRSGPIVKQVHSVTDRLVKATKNPMFVKQFKIPDIPFQWHVEVVESREVNAFCLPGGKMVVYTAILPVCQTESGLATVMGHEISHALCRHGNARMTQQKMVTVGLGAANAGLGDLDPRQRQRILQVLNAGSKFGILAYGRKHESQADRMGLYLMAAAGFDPKEAVKFWERMQARAGGGKTPEFLSTHPSHETRIRDLLNLIPRAEPLYRASPDRDLPDEKLLWPPT
jgi:predicted Zn-dependent protease